jgi:hypothetical protein
MQRRQATILAAAVAAAVTLTVAGCDRPAGTQTVGKSNPDATTSIDRSTAQNAADSARDTVPSTAMNMPRDTSATVAAVRDDSMITASVTKAIQADPALRSMDIGIDTKAGKVTLSGSVDTNEMKEHARQIVAATPGVAGVVDNLAVRNAG